MGYMIVPVPAPNSDSNELTKSEYIHLSREYLFLKAATEASLT